MKKILCFVLPFALPLLALGMLLAPTGLVVPVSDDIIHASWDPVEGAVKYSVNIVADYDTDEDGEADLSVDFDFGTSDRDDGLEMSYPALDIPLSELDMPIVDELGNITGYLSPVSAQARVKALDPGKAKGRQNNPFCPFVEIVLP